MSHDEEAAARVMMRKCRMSNEDTGGYRAKQGRAGHERRGPGAGMLWPAWFIECCGQPGFRLLDPLANQGSGSWIPWPR